MREKKTKKFDYRAPRSMFADAKSSDGGVEGHTPDLGEFAAKRVGNRPSVKLAPAFEAGIKPGPSEANPVHVDGRPLGVTGDMSPSVIAAIVGAPEAVPGNGGPQTIAVVQVDPHEQSGIKYSGVVVLQQFPKPIGKRGRPRIEDRDKTLAAGKPWEAAGMSRASWYRRQKEAK